MTDSAPSYNVKSASRFIDILELVAAAPKPRRFSEIASALDLPKSSLYHLLSTMTAREYLAAAGGGYILGPAVTRLANHVGGPESLAGRAPPVLAKMADGLNETCGYYELRDDEVEVLRTDLGRQPLSYTLRQGARAPLYCVSAGKVLLAHMKEKARAAYLDRVKFNPITATTIKDKEGLLAELEEVRATEFGYSREEYTPGVIGISTPVRMQGKVVGALSVALPAVRQNEEMLNRIKRTLLEAASDLQRGAGL